MTKFTGLEKAEAGRLREAVKMLEALLASGDTPRGVSSMLLTNLLDGMKRRAEAIEDTEKQAVAEEHEKSLRDVAIAVAVQRETALTAAEQEQYAGFLREEFFTRDDFGKLEEFYRSAWDRLSDEGKAEMSHRIWEGVRRNEYEFSELPDIVKEKEAARLRDQLSMKSLTPDSQRIPESDRTDFLREWDSGNRGEAYKILNRSCARRGNDRNS